MAKTKHTFGEYKCKICSKVFSERTSLTHHTQLHKSGKPFSCSECSFTCKTKKYLSRHVTRVHRKREKDSECEICGKKFLFKTYLDKHMYIHANERPFKCEVCNKGFNSRYSLSSHKHLHTGAKPYKCSYCEYACRDNSTLRKHQERHTGVTRLYQCTVCDKSYKTKRALKTHIAEVHLELTLKTKPCPDCGKLFKCLKTLNSHIKISHLKVNSCKCEICGAALSSKYNMRAHLTTHIDYRPFKCSFQGCDGSFKDKGTLKKHEIIHYPEKHFECSICKKKFSRLHRLQVHKKQHKAKKKCVFCDYCGKSFYNKNYIRAHITRKHMYKQRYICDMCGFMTYNKPSIVMHIKHGHVSEMDRKCKICKKTFKKHIYLKLHYWNTHSIKYKMNRRRFRQPKRKTNNIIIEETEEPDVKDIQLIHEIKVEQLSDTEEMTDAMEYSNSVLSKDVSRAMCDTNEITPDKKFKDFFIQHVVMPPASHDEVSESQEKETDIYVDVTCQREAERIREAMLHKWRQNVGVRPFVRLKRHKDAVINRLNNVKKEKIEITVFSENESHVPAIDEDETKRKNTNTHRKTNVCDKINETIEKFNNLFNEDIREGDEVSKINYKISRIAEEIRNNLEKNSNHCNKQILKILDKTFAKYNNLVAKMSDIQNKKQQLSTNIDEVTDRSDEQASIGDENKQSNENNNTMTSLDNEGSRSNDVIEKGEDSTSISDENRRNSIHNENNDGIISSVNEELISVDMIKTDDDQALIDVDNSKDSNDEIPVTYQYDDYLVSIGIENRKHSENKEKTDEISSLENDESNSEVTKSGVEILIGAENIRNGEYMKLNDEIKSSENNEIRSDNIPITGDSQALLGDENPLNSNNCKELYGGTSENDESKCGERIQTGDDQASIGVENIKNCESIENDKTIINYSADLGQINLGNNVSDVNQVNSCHNEIIYENSLAESVKLRRRKCVNTAQNVSYIDGTDDDDFRYTNNLKEINNIIKEIDDMVASIENDETLKNYQSNSKEIHVVNNSEKLHSIKCTRKPRRKKCKRNLKNRVNQKSDVNRTTKIKEIRNELEETNDGIASTENNEIASIENNEKASTENNEIASTENNEIETEINEIASTKLQENEGKNMENHLEERDINKIWTRRSVRNHNKKVNIDMDSHNDFDSDDDRDQDFVPNDDNDDDDDESDEERNKSNKFKFNSHQCYICFKLYETKEKLLDHCKEHFDVCNLKMLKKCPFCNFVTKLDLVRHVRLIHKVNLNYLYGTLKDRKNNNAKSRFYFNVKNNLVDEVEVIPSITNLNRQAFLKIDRKRREKNDKEVKKTRLVKKDGEWIVEKVLINTKKENYVLPDKVEELLKNSEKEKDDENDKDNVDNIMETNEDAGNNDEKQPESDENGNNEDGKGPNIEDYCVKMQKLYRIAKKNGQKMLFPCNKCEKICQSLSALKLHLRRHDPNAKPFKKKVWKHKLSEDELKKIEENKQKDKNITKNHKNRYEKPKPIVNKHKCDPKLKDFYEKNIKGGDIEFWQFLKIFNKMNRENVNDFSDLENRTEFGNHFVDPDLNPPNDENGSSIEDLNPSKESVSSKSNSNLNPMKLGNSKSSKKGVVNKISKETKLTKFKRTILITKNEFLRRNAIKDLLRKKNLEKSNTHT